MHANCVSVQVSNHSSRENISDESCAAVTHSKERRTSHMRILIESIRGTNPRQPRATTPEVIISRQRLPRPEKERQTNHACCSVRDQLTAQYN